MYPSRFARLTQQIVEQLANVLVRLEPVVDRRLEPGVDVSEVKLAVESEEDLVCAEGHQLSPKTERDTGLGESDGGRRESEGSGSGCEG
jgi:hypothetical protein